jgi:hypothetical protein
MGMAVFAALIGVTLIGLYSWSIDGYQELIANCNSFINSLLKVCEWIHRQIRLNYKITYILNIIKLLNFFNHLFS